MRRSTLLALCGASGQLRLEETAGRGETVLRGWLRDPLGARPVPICGGFPLFSEHADPSRTDLERLERRLFGSEEEFEEFLSRKRARPAWDLYALSQPFSEATRALDPLLELLRESLCPGDLILDLWCRTGWTGELLASEFPEQSVLSLWGGNRDLLGYRGFAHWLGEGRRAANLDVAFLDPSEPLPLASGSVALVHGFDVLHRLDAATLLPELLRVCRDDASLVFPHVHLADGSPPGFAREGRIEPAAVHAARVHALPGVGRRRAFILSEQRLFEGGYERLPDGPGPDHHNGLVLVTDAARSGAPLSRVRVDPSPGAFPILNALPDVDLAAARVLVDPGRLACGVGELLGRHPIYTQVLDRALPRALSPSRCLLLYWADRCLSVEEISMRMGIGLEAVISGLAELGELELLQCRSVSRSMARLQRYYGAQRRIEVPTEQTLPSLWWKAVDRHSGRPYLSWAEDEDVFTYAQAAQLVEAAGGILERAGVGRGDRVCVWSDPHPEAAFLFWACALAGAVFVPFDPRWSEERCRETVADCEPRLLVVDGGRPFPTAPGRLARLRLDPSPEEALPDDAPSFSSEAALPGSSGSCEVHELDVAAILYTSGTTGRPRGVALSHGSLYRTAAVLADSYEWVARDVVLASGGLHAISGLRNPVIATVRVGASAVLPGRPGAGFLALAGLAEERGVSILSTTPALLERLCSVGERLRGRLSRLRLTLSTAAPLGGELRRRFEELTAAPVADYYGLTESGGVCLLNRPGSGVPEGVFTVPGDVIAQVVDPDGRVLDPGSVGELRLAGANLMSGYFRRPDRTREMLRDGWLYTGDLARRLPDGALQLCGRRRRILKHPDGDLVDLVAIESVLAAQPGVSEVAAFGYRDSRGDERVAAFVVPSSSGTSENALADWRREIGSRIDLRHVPETLAIVPALPRDAEGQVLEEALMRGVRTP